jgi:hypothetical protein
VPAFFVWFVDIPIPSPFYLPPLLVRHCLRPPMERFMSA